MTVRMMRMDSITPANIVQQRVKGVSQEVAADYAEALENGETLPPIDVYRQGNTYRIADGFHRYAAHEIAGLEKIRCRIFDGGESKAIVHACGANQGHGLRRTNADKRQAVTTLLRVMKKSSDRKIAEIAGVSPTTVSSVRAEVSKLGTPTIGGESSPVDHDGSMPVEEVDDTEVDECENSEPDDTSDSEPEAEEDHQRAMRLAKRCDALIKDLKKEPDAIRFHPLLTDAINRLKTELRRKS